LLLWAMYGASSNHAPAADTILAIQLIRTPGESGNIPGLLQTDSPVPDARSVDKQAGAGQGASEMPQPRKQWQALTKQGRVAVTHAHAGKETALQSTPRVLSSEAASGSKPTAAETPPFSITPIYTRKPEYPRLARRLGIEGKVLLHVLTALNGVPEMVTVISSSGYPVLDNAAVEAVNDWRFRVILAVAAFQGFPSVDVPISFKLN